MRSGKNNQFDLLPPTLRQGPALRSWVRKWQIPSDRRAARQTRKSSPFKSATLAGACFNDKFRCVDGRRGVRCRRATGPNRKSRSLSVGNDSGNLSWRQKLQMTRRQFVFGLLLLKGSRSHCTTTNGGTDVVKVAGSYRPVDSDGETTERPTRQEFRG